MYAQIRSSSPLSTERRFTSMYASEGMAFGETPPRITPMLKTVRGSSGTSMSAMRAAARAMALFTFGTPKSLRAWPPRPEKVKRYVQLAIALVTRDSGFPPSMERKAPIFRPEVNRWRSSFPSAAGKA